MVLFVGLSAVLILLEVIDERVGAGRDIVEVAASHVEIVDHFVDFVGSLRFQHFLVHHLAMAVRIAG